MVRQTGAGLWSWLPAGWRVHQNVVQIVREEMDAIGCQEMLAPVITPARPVEAQRPLGDPGGLQLQDRKGADLLLALSHEETMTFHVANAVRSYRELPKQLYHFQTKGRDEARPRAGVLRTREFIMKDAYSFDRDAAGLDASYELYRAAYGRVFDRVGLDWYECESDVGMMGGTGAHEYMAPAPAGENDVALAPGYRANLEIASAEPSPAQPAPQLTGGARDTRHDDDRGRRRPPWRARGRAAQGVPGGRPSRAGCDGLPARRPPAQRHQARRTRSGEPFRPASEERAARARRLPRPDR